jgi:hypothetical protein
MYCSVPPRVNTSRFVQGMGVYIETLQGLNVSPYQFSITCDLEKAIKGSTRFRESWCYENTEMKLKWRVVGGGDI